jgi:hypothetical protein
VCVALWALGVTAGPWAIGCGNGDPQLATNENSGGAGSKAYSVGLGGDAGAAGEADQPDGGDGGQNDGGGSGDPGGFGGQASSSGANSGGKGGAPCTGTLEPLPACAEPTKGACATCVCASDACAQHWADCAASEGCARAVSCLTHGCSAETCAEQAGKGQMKLVALLTCLGGGCSAPCGQGSAGSGGSAGQGAAGKGAGQGGSAGQGAAGKGGTGQGGSGGSNGTGGQAGTGGISGKGGSAGSAGSAASGLAGSAGQGGTSSGSPALACQAPQSSSTGLCAEPAGTSTCNPITGVPCKAGEVCAPEAGQLTGFACVAPKMTAALCQGCGSGVECAAGLLCAPEFQRCSQPCCDDQDCAPGNRCAALAGGGAFGVCLEGSP